MDDLEPPRPPGTEDSRPEPEQEPGAGSPGTAVVEQQQSVEFDSPDSGLPSSRNYSVTSGIQSSIDEGQSVGFEEDGGGEEGSDGSVPAAHAFSEPQDRSSPLRIRSLALWAVHKREPGAPPAPAPHLPSSPCHFPPLSPPLSVSAPSPPICRTSGTRSWRKQRYWNSPWAT